MAERISLNVVSQRFRHLLGRWPLTRRDVGDHTVHEMGRELAHPPSFARGAETARLARARHEQVERTARTAHPTKAARDFTTVDEGAQLPLDVVRQRASAVLVRVATEEGLDLRTQDPAHDVARRVAAHHGDDAGTWHVFGAARPTVLPGVEGALADPRAPPGLDGGVDRGLHGTETDARAIGLQPFDRGVRLPCDQVRRRSSDRSRSRAVLPTQDVVATDRLTIVFYGSVVQAASATGLVASGRLFGAERRRRAGFGGGAPRKPALELREAALGGAQRRARARTPLRTSPSAPRDVGPHELRNHVQAVDVDARGL